MGEAEANI